MLYAAFSQIEAGGLVLTFRKCRFFLRAASNYRIFCNNLGLSNILPALYLIRQMPLPGNLSSILASLLFTIVYLSCGLNLRVASIRENTACTPRNSDAEREEIGDVEGILSVPHLSSIISVD